MGIRKIIREELEDDWVKDVEYWDGLKEGEGFLDWDLEDNTPFIPEGVIIDTQESKLSTSEIMSRLYSFGYSWGGAHRNHPFRYIFVGPMEIEIINGTYTTKVPEKIIMHDEELSPYLIIKNHKSIDPKSLTITINE